MIKKTNGRLMYSEKKMNEKINIQQTPLDMDRRVYQGMGGQKKA